MVSIEQNQGESYKINCDVHSLLLDVYFYKNVQQGQLSTHIMVPNTKQNWKVKNIAPRRRFQKSKEGKPNARYMKNSYAYRQLTRLLWRFRQTEISLMNQCHHIKLK